MVVKQQTRQEGRSLVSSLRALLAPVAVGVALAFTGSVSAVSNQAPDPSDFNPNGTGATNDGVLLIVSQKSPGTTKSGANGLDAPSSRVSIYSTSKTPTITITSPNQCKTGDPDTHNNPYYSLGLNYTTEFQYSWNGGKKEPTGSKDPDNNQWGRNYIADKGSGECTAANNKWVTAFNLPETAAITLDGTKYYAVHLSANIRDDVVHGSVNAFRVITNSGIVSFSSTSGKKFALQDRLAAGADYSTFHLEFALPCTASTQSKTFEWFDADQGQGNQPKQLSYELWRKPRTGGSWVKQAGPNTSLGGNDVSGSATYTIHKDYIYDWRWLNVAKSNGIQFEIPFSSIHSKFLCKDDAKITPSVALSPNSIVADGDTVTATAKFTNTTAFTGKVTYTRQFWKSNGTDGFSLLQGDVAVHSAETNTVSVPSTDLNLLAWTAPADSNFSYLCTALVSISAQDTAAVDTILTASSAGPVCTSDAKFPGLRVGGGDARTGGTFPTSPQASCKLPVGTPSLYATDPTAYLRQFNIHGHDYSGAGLAKGSYGGQAVISPGVISSFGSQGSYYAGYDTASARLLFGSRKGHVPNWPQEGIYYGSGATNNTASHCLDSLEDIEPGGVPIVSKDKTITASATGRYSFGTNKGGTLTIQGAVFGVNGGRHIIRVTQDDIPRSSAELNKVVITGDVTFSDGPYGSVAELPQFILVIDDTIKLVFADGVTRVDGIISSRGDIFTCGGVANKGFDGSTGVLTKSGACDDPLTVNGSVITSRSVYPYRTAGFDTVADTSVAELFNLRSDILIGDYVRGRSLQKLQTTYQQEAPPRF